MRVRFFADSPALTTIRWYGVPDDRPTMPYPSFVANEAWGNVNGPFSGMLYGKAPFEQGVQMDPPPRYVVATPRDEFNADHLCGNPAQWSGDLRTDRPGDLGRIDCCLPRDGGLSIGGGADFGHPAGVMLDGSAVVGSHRGGVSLDGSATVASISGGVSLDGSADVSTTAPDPDYGGVSLDGSADVSTTAPDPDYGGVSLDGSADVSTTAPDPDYGGVSLDGSADVSSGGGP